MLATAADRVTTAATRTSYTSTVAAAKPTASTVTSTSTDMSLPVRAGIVGTAVGLATPAFPVIGFVRAVNHFIPYRPLRIAITGGTFALLSFAIRDLLPFLYVHAPLLAPCAMVNAAFAGALYLGLDVALGGPHKLLQVGRLPVPRNWRFWKGRWPAVGLGIGVATALVAPYLYPAVTFWHFGIELDPGMAATFRNLYNRGVDLLLPVTLVTGAIAGSTLQLVLAPILTGAIPGASASLLGPIVLAVLCATCLFVFWSRDPLGVAAYNAGIDALDRLVPRADMPEPVLGLDELLTPAQVDAFRSVKRLDYRTGAVGSAAGVLPTAHIVPGALPAVVLDNGDAATRGAELRDEFDVRVAASRAAVYPTSGQAQLLRLAKRFPLLELVTPREESQVTTPQAKQLLPRRQLTTDAVARVCYLARTGGPRAPGLYTAGSPAPVAAAGEVQRPLPLLGASHVATQEVAELAIELRGRRREDENPAYSRQLQSPIELAALTKRALRAVALRRTMSQRDFLGTAELKLQLREAAAMKKQRWLIENGTVDVAYLDKLLAKMGAHVDVDTDWREPAQAEEKLTNAIKLTAAGVATAALVGIIYTLASAGK